MLHAAVENGLVVACRRPCCLLRPAAAALIALAWSAPAALPADDRQAEPEPLAAAHQLYWTGKYAEASEAYAKLAEKHPAAAIGVARCQAAGGKYDQARQTLTEAAQKHAKAAGIPAELAVLAFDRGDYKAAQSHAAAALKLDEANCAARWIVGELHRVAGWLKEAEAAYEWFIDHFNATQNFTNAEDLRYVGLGAAHYARWNRNHGQFSFLVNTLYPDALKLNKRYWPAHYEQILLFIEKFNRADAASELNKALAINPHAAELHAAKAKLALQKFDLEMAKTSIERALKQNPNLLSAHQLKADLLLADFRDRDALAVLKRALPLNPQSEETLGRLAAVYGVIEGLKPGGATGRMRELIDEAAARNPHCGQFHRTLAETLDLVRKYPFAAAYYKEAARRMPQLVGVRGRLGLMYMRLGDEPQAARLLKESFEIDPFNVRVNNMLKVLDVLKDYAVLETEHFIIKYDKQHDALLARYAARYLEDEVYPEITRVMGYEPKGKSLFEIFNRAKQTGGHSWFSARMVGLPYIGTVGACAGKVVALASPEAMPKPFNWARVLKHEFVHVVNLQQTNFNIPHWYTEALAVLSEGYPRSSTWNAMLARRVPAGKMLNLDNINWGFIRPRDREERSLAYCQAEIYAEYMLATYGDDALAKLLAAYADNLGTEAALKRCFGVEKAEFEKGFRAHLDKLVAGLAGGAGQGGAAALTFEELKKRAAEEPKNAEVQARLAAEYLRRRDATKARTYAKAAVEHKQDHPLANYVLARLELAAGKKAEATARLAKTLDEKAPHADSLWVLTVLKLRDEDWDEARKFAELGEKTFPEQDRWLKALIHIDDKTGGADRTPVLLEKLAARDADHFPARKRLAELALKNKDYKACARWCREANFIVVKDADIHAMWGESLAKLGKHAAAAEEYEVALTLKADQTAWELALAQSLQAAGKDAKAWAVLQALLTLEPENAAARELLDSLKK